MSDRKDKMERKTKLTETELLPIPDKLYFTIGEVAELCALKPHVLRYWEQEFPQLSPSKRRGNRRYYQRKEVVLVRQIQELLYTKGFTIEGARTYLDSTEGAQMNKTQNSHAVMQLAITQLENIAEELEEIV